MTDHTIPWDYLPKELLQIIGTRLDSRVDVLRFRSVCKSWRSTVPPPCFDQEIPPLVLKLPPPISIDAVLLPTAVSRVQLLHRHHSSSSPSKGWLAKIGVSTHGQFQILHPVTNQAIRHPFKFNLLDDAFVNFNTGFRLRRVSCLSRHVFGVNKVVLFPASASCDRVYGYGILAIYHEGKLGYWKYGDDKWNLLDDKNFQYDDIVEYKGQFYVVDRWGTVYWIKSSLNLVPYAPSLYGCGGQKNLVESCGELYVVDRYLDGERRTWRDHVDVDWNNFTHLSRHRLCNPPAIDFRVYKLDEERGTWVDVKSLGDRDFVLGIDCSFFISSKDFKGGRGNNIYFIDDEFYTERGFSADTVRVFQLEDSSIRKLAEVPELNKIFLPDMRYELLKNFSAVMKMDSNNQYPKLSATTPHFSPMHVLTFTILPLCLSLSSRFRQFDCLSHVDTPGPVCRFRQACTVNYSTEDYGLKLSGTFCLF